jgi:hypothetical protein
MKHCVYSCFFYPPFLSTCCSTENRGWKTIMLLEAEYIQCYWTAWVATQFWPKFKRQYLNIPPGCSVPLTYGKHLQPPQAPRLLLSHLHAPDIRALSESLVCSASTGTILIEASQISIGSFHIWLFQVLSPKYLIERMACGFIEDTESNVSVLGGLSVYDFQQWLHSWQESLRYLLEARRRTVWRWPHLIDITINKTTIFSPGT